MSTLIKWSRVRRRPTLLVHLPAYGSKYSTTTDEVVQEGSISEQIEKPERLFFKNQPEIDGFKVFDPYMNKKRDGYSFAPRTRSSFVKRTRDDMARYLKMSVDQDWNSVWPTACMFKQSAVPIAVCQGVAKNSAENDGMPPEKYGNTELIKIPNFLHLTPPQIKLHCEAIKKFCTKWPHELKSDEDCEKHFPVEITTSSYIYDGPSIRDDRARKVTLQIKLSALDLDDRSRFKFKELVGERYDPKTDTLTLESERCPYRHQNEDYVNYLLTTLYFESKKIEDWEKDITEKFAWQGSESKANVIKLLNSAGEKVNEEAILGLDKVKSYKEAVSRLMDEGETFSNISSYKESVLSLLKIKTTAV